MSGRLVLVRHGQSVSNVERRLDTRPPGAELTDLGRQQAREFAHRLTHPTALLAHSVAVRAAQTAGEIGGQLGLDTCQLDGIYEVQVGELEMRNDDEAVDAFDEVYARWHKGELDITVPGGESGRQVLDRFVPVVTELRMRYLDNHNWTGDIILVSHGAAIRLVAATLAGVDGAFVVDHHLANTESVVLAPITDGRWSCLQWGELAPPFYPKSDENPNAESLESADPMG